MSVEFSDLETFGQLKELYADESWYQEHIQSSIMEHVKEAPEGAVEFDGNQFNVGVTFELNESYAAINDNERIPEAGTQKGLFAKYKPKRMYSGLELTTFAATRGHGSGRPTGKYLDDYVKGTLLAFMSNCDSDFYANGRGFRAEVETATATQANFTCTFTTRLRPGMILDWYNSTYATKRGSIKVAAKGIDRLNRRVYIDANFGTGEVPSGATAGDVLVVYGALAANEPSDGRHIAGFERITDSSLALGTLDPSDYAWWLPTNINANGANPSQVLLQEHIDAMYNIGGRYPNKAAFNTSFKRGYLNQFLSQRRFTSNSYDTGASSLTFSPVKMGKDQKGVNPEQIDMLEDKNCTPDTFYAWHDDACMYATDYANAPHLADEDGNEFRIKAGYDSMSAFYRFWFNTVITQRNLVGKTFGYASQSSQI